MAIVETPLPRRERERLERRQAMLTAAQHVFATKGYEQATLDEVADLAEFGKGTLYNYFPDGKESILFALFEDLFASLANIARQHFAGAENLSAREAFRGLIGRLIEHFTENRTTFLLLMKEAQRLMFSNENDKVATLIAHRDMAIMELVKPIAQRIESGEMKPHPPVAIAHMLMGNVKGYLSFAFCADGAECDSQMMAMTSEQATDFITEILFDGLLTSR